MSSHHFVREGQEPALLVIDALSYELVAPLLEWAPHVAVVDRVLPAVMLWEIKIDFVLLASGTDNEGLERLKAEQPVEIVSYRDDNAILSGIEILQRYGNTAINIIIENPYPAMGHLAMAGNFPLTFLTPELRWSLITKGHFEKWLPKGSELRVIPQNSELFAFSGLEVSKDACRTISDGIVSIKSDAPFWLGEYL